jgi:hypothetical protein
VTLEESWAMAHYLRSFVSGSEIARPEVGPATGSGPAKPTRAGGPGSNSEPPPLPAGETVSPYNRKISQVRHFCKS